MERKRLLILNSYPHNIGWAEKFIIGLALGSKEKGLGVYLGLRKGSRFIHEALKYNIPIYSHPLYKIRVIHNRLNLLHVFYKPLIQRSFRKELNLSNNHFIIMDIWRISPPKNEMKAIEMAEMALPCLKNVYLVIIGKPVNKDYFQILPGRKENSTSKVQIFILGHLEDISQILINKILLFSNSTDEGLQNVMIEAGFFVDRVIGRDTNGNREIVLNGINLFLLPEEVCIKNFAELIIRIYNDRHLAEKMSRAA